MHASMSTTGRIGVGIKNGACGALGVSQNARLLANRGLFSVIGLVEINSARISYANE
jgi:hypothetical protein